MLDLYKYTEKEQKELLSSIQILVDTREKKNDHITNYFDSKGIIWKKKALSCGDYSFQVPKNDDLNIPRDLDFSNQIIIERKNSLEEISSCFTETRDRLKKEFALAPENKIMIIENATYEDMVSGNYNTKYDKKSFTASFHSFWCEFNLPIVFMPNHLLTGQFICLYFYYYFRSIIK